MALFVAVAEESGFAAAARRLSLSPPKVTRAVASLEQHVSTPLLLRTTRSVRLTESGQRYLADCRRILAELAEAEEAADGAHATPRGLLSITAPALFGQMFVTPLATRYLDRYPEVRLRALFVDRVVGMADEGIDVAIRIGELPDSALIALSAGHVRRVVCAAPALLAREGIPQHPAELERFRIVQAANVTQTNEWRFAAGGDTLAVRIAPTLSVNSNRAAIVAAERGFGLTRVLSYQIAPQLAAGTLQIVLPAFEPPPLPIHVLYQQGRKASAKVRSFVDFCIAQLRADPAIN